MIDIFMYYMLALIGLTIYTWGRGSKTSPKFLLFLSVNWFAAMTALSMNAIATNKDYVFGTILGLAALLEAYRSTKLLNVAFPTKEKEPAEEKAAEEEPTEEEPDDENNPTPG